MIAYRLFGGRWLLRLIMSLSWAQSSARSPSPARRMTSPGRRLHRHLTVLKADGTVVSKKIGAPPINVLATLKITVYLLNWREFTWNCVWSNFYTGMYFNQPYHYYLGLCCNLASFTFCRTSRQIDAKHLTLEIGIGIGIGSADMVKRDRTGARSEGIERRRTTGRRGRLGSLARSLCEPQKIPLNCVRCSRSTQTRRHVFSAFFVAFCLWLCAKKDISAGGGRMTVVHRIGGSLVRRYCVSSIMHCVRPRPACWHFYSKQLSNIYKLAEKKGAGGAGEEQERSRRRMMRGSWCMMHAQWLYFRVTV